MGARINKRRSMKSMVKEETYELRWPRFYFFLGIIGAIFCLFLFVLSVISNEEPYICIGFIIFCMGCIFVALNAKLWKISVNGDKLVVCRVARSPIEVDIHAIEYVELKHTCINVYMSGKKQLGVTRGVDGFWRLCDRLNELGKMHPSKMDPTQNRDFFSIKRNRVGWLVFSGIVVIVFGAGLVMMFLSVLVIKPEETSFFFMDVDAIFYGIVCSL